jgi:hypothetical protein
LSGYFQPVEIRAPQGARISLAQEGAFGPAQPAPALVGLQIGPVYRLKITEIPNLPGEEVFPTIEVVDRTYPPPELALRYPIPIELTQEELRMASEGIFVTRVIYVEDPNQALPIGQQVDGEQAWFEAAPGEDPLVAADQLGRPVAILRIGSRAPTDFGGNAGFDYGAAPFMQYDTSAGDFDGSSPQEFVMPPEFMQQ